jgi:hypothetical protein
MRILDRLFRRRRRARQHPTPDMALDALSEGMCLYRPVSSCSSPPRSVGLRDENDNHAILVCKAHYWRLRHMPPRDLDRLERVLLEAFKPSRNRAMVG